MKVLVIGKGGREHALAWKLKQSPKVSKIYYTPIENAGLQNIAKGIPIDKLNIENVINVVKKHDIDLTIVGPEQLLTDGIVDRFKKEGLKIFGPDKASSWLERSKSYAKKVLHGLGIPIPDFMVLDNPYQAVDIVEFMNQPLVIKADGLCAGKGVFVCDNKKDAVKAIHEIMVKKAGKTIVIEKRLEGKELSFMCFVDGKYVQPMPITKDFKRGLDNNKGKNTGGVACYGPVHIDESLYKEIMHTIVNPLVSSLSTSGIIYKGVLYVGLMIVKNKPKVLEINVRFGDPECQVLMSLLETDLIDIIEAIEHQKLDKINITWRNTSAVCIVPYSQGYPDAYKTGEKIFGLNKEYQDTFIFHSGTKKIKNNKILTNGGRVLSVTSTGNTLIEARNKAYACIGSNAINFNNMCYRKDVLTISSTVKSLFA